MDRRHERLLTDIRGDGPAERPIGDGGVEQGYTVLSRRTPEYGPDRPDVRHGQTAADRDDLLHK